MIDINHLSVPERAALTSGGTFWETKTVHGYPPIAFSDGPHGVRRQLENADHLGIAESVPATCFPPAAALAQTWDPSLVRRVGAALGVEARSLSVDVLLGPGINIKRDPRGGRNFEYFSEDPFLTGALGEWWVRGLQSEGVGAALKHFAAYSSETDRMRASSDVDERTLREIYLRGFERIVKKAKPWTVMCSYNRLNGVYTAENRWLLTDVLRGEWDFDGVVISDWGGVRDRVASLDAGLDIEMPANGGLSDALVVSAIEEGLIGADRLETAARRVAALVEKAEAVAGAPVGFSVTDHHTLAREVAGRSIVLLKNDDRVLPLRSGGSIAVIGEFAKSPRIQGGGSSRVNPTIVDTPFDEIRDRNGGSAVTFTAGFATNGSEDADELRADALRAATGAETVVLFLGPGDAQSSEGFDRDNIELPDDQLHLLRTIAAVHHRVVVVLTSGGVLGLTDVTAHAAGILSTSLLGQGGGRGIADVLFGIVNPSARLTETVPKRLEDVPAFLTAFAENQHTVYGERHFVGYRWYDARQMDVEYPFGHGMSYTSFAYGDLTVTLVEDRLSASFDITNTGDRDGREVPQLYFGVFESVISRAPRALVGFDSVVLERGETRRITIDVPLTELAYWDSRMSRWVIETGRYNLFVGASSRDVRSTTTVMISGDDAPPPLTLSSTLGEVLEHPGAQNLARTLLGGSADAMADGTNELGIDMARMMASIPIARWVTLSAGALTREALTQALDAINTSGAPWPVRFGPAPSAQD
ncbi:glycoside hydrolase family 3 C-terminal domain-containing protein [Microbacterium sp. LWH7-1.2]|uniref:glycoside hydrolase family 3 C-terminal domain-containing protein n=1 Tax=Microbacterium sp. LWH7-1.2 TaxID=3135257 RepID=UPI003139C029